MTTIARWGLVAGGVLFLLAGVIRWLRTDAISPVLFVLGLALLLLGFVLAKRARPAA